MTTSLYTTRPIKTEYRDYYSRYIDRVPEGTDILEMLDSGVEQTIHLLEDLDDEGALFRYAPEKWSIKEVLGHLCDTERVFCHRALWFARGAEGSQAGFEQDDWIAPAAFDKVPLTSLLSGMVELRRATVSFYRQLPAAAWDASGLADGTELSVRATAWIIAGHEVHHREVLMERYIAN